MPKAFSIQILGPVDLKSLKRILYAIGNKNEVAVVLFGFCDSVLLRGEDNTLHRCCPDLVVLGVTLFMLRVSFTRGQLLFKKIQILVEGDLV
ncbi:MAG: hypothetical protein Q7I97_04225, partial [Thermovirgaceae bacterium]|nr:hypothetical protein [Thermovirgaceae bacterium]